MVRRELALLCACLLLANLTGRPVQALQQPRDPTTEMKQRVSEIPAGSIVEVKLHKQPKIRGRLGAITDSAFDVQHMKNDKLLTESLAYQDVKAIKIAGKGMSLGKKIVVGTLIGAGVLLIIGIVGCAATGCFNS